MRVPRQFRLFCRRLALDLGASLKATFLRWSPFRRRPSPPMHEKSPSDRKAGWKHDPFDCMVADALDRKLRSQRFQIRFCARGAQHRRKTRPGRGGLSRDIGQPILDVHFRIGATPGQHCYKILPYLAEKHHSVCSVLSPDYFIIGG
jgi:hypothetical protein